MQTQHSFHELASRATRVGKYVIPGVLLVIALVSITLMRAPDFAAPLAVSALGMFVLMHHIDLVTRESRNTPPVEVAWHLLVIAPCILVAMSVARRAAYTYVTGNVPPEMSSALSSFPAWLLLLGLALALVVALCISVVWRRAQAVEADPQQ
jgi:hypothetical protein